jgi:HAD superfamily hydrolase (TIGR01490 family)
VIAAVFDVDRTLLPDTTAERLFLGYLIHERVLGVRAALETLRFLAVRGRTSPIAATKRNRPYLRGQQASLLATLGARCFDEAIRPRLSARGVERVRWHTEHGHRVVLLSGSIPYVIEPMAQALGVEDVICSRLDERAQRLTGRIVGLHPYGAAKAMLIREFAGRFRIELDHSFCYADHHTDEHVLRLFGQPVCVNPNARLLRIAQRFSWPVEEFR